MSWASTASAPRSADATASSMSPPRCPTTAAALPHVAGTRASCRGGNQERDQRGGRHGRSPRGLHVFLRRRAHEPQQEPRRRPRRDLLERLRIVQNLYCCAKMMAEITATEEAAKRGLQLVVVLPSMTVGPMLQQTLNFSSNHVARYLMGTKKTYPNAVAAYTDVRDVARAHVLAYERPDARGRYLCIGTVLHRAEFLQLLKDLFPQYPVTAKCEDDGKPMEEPYKFSNQRLKDLRLEFTPLRKSLYEAVICLQHKGHLPLPVPVPQRAYL